MYDDFGGDCTVQVDALREKLRESGVPSKIIKCVDPHNPSSTHVALLVRYENTQTFGDFKDHAFILLDPGLHHPYPFLFYDPSISPLSNQNSRWNVVTKKYFFLATCADHKIKLITQPLGSARCLEAVFDLKEEMTDEELFALMKSGQVTHSGVIETNYHKFSINGSKMQVSIRGSNAFSISNIESFDNAAVHFKSESEEFLDYLKKIYLWCCQHEQDEKAQKEQKEKEKQEKKKKGKEEHEAKNSRSK